MKSRGGENAIKSERKMHSIHCSTGWVSLISGAGTIALLFLAVATGSATSRAEGRTATVEFLDGSTLSLRDASFIYVWHSRSESNFINRSTHEYESQDFSYSVVVKGTELTKIVSGQRMTGLELHYKTLDDDHLLLERALISVRDGEPVAVPVTFRDRYQGVELPEALLGKDDPAVLEYIAIAGTTTIEGQVGKFRAKLMDPGSTSWLARQERENEICHGCKDRSEIVKSVRFLDGK